MKRVFIVALMVALLVAMAAPAFAAPGGRADQARNCGLSTQGANAAGSDPGDVGALISTIASSPYLLPGTIGRSVVPEAIDCSVL
jgi:hypothetical protein